MTPRILSSSKAEIVERPRRVPNADFFVPSGMVDLMVDHAEAGLSENVEVLGLIVGRFYRDADGVYAVAERVISVPTVGDEFSVAICESGQPELVDAMDDLAEGEAVVGWYHSHLGIGCFMSDTDVRTQDGLFGGECGFAVVVDPVKGELAFFDSNPGEPMPARTIIME
ncbi:MAG: hypothetical protein GX224_03355 [Thermoplasmatales archaeon]|nr:hypothetical protein [Thermoplasmatales archaeon]